MPDTPKKMAGASTWQQEGSQPDYRFSLANERTFLAWIRTAMSLLAGGVLLSQLAEKLALHLLMKSLAVVLGVMAICICIGAYRRWRSSEIAMRLQRPLPSGKPLLVFSCALAILALAFTGYMAR